MRTGSRSGSDGHLSRAEGEGDDYLLSIPEPAHTASASPELPLTMSPDEMLRQYAAKRAAGGISSPPPSPVPPPPASHWNKVKGRKLSLRNGFGMVGKKGKRGSGSEKGIEGGREVGAGPKGLVISYPVPAATAAGVDGHPQEQEHYSIGEEEEEDYDNAYGGVSV